MTYARSVKLLLAAALAALAAQAGAASGATGCSRATARTLFARTNVEIPSLESGKIRVSASQADQVICADLTRDGRTDMAVTLASGGTAGDIGFVVFRRVGAGWKVSLVRSGYKLGLYRVDGDLVSSQPVYRKNDPNCCPTGGFDHTRWHWNGTRFAAVRTYHTKSFTP
jgi:hypothetical protein